MNYMFWNMRKTINRIIVMCVAFVVLACNLCVVHAEESAYYAGNNEESTQYYRTKTRTKKGIQEAEKYTEAEELGVSHTLFNVCLNQLMNGSNAHIYKGKTYYFDDVPRMTTEVVSEFNRNDISVTAVLLLQMDYRATQHNLIYPGARGNMSKSYYAWNVVDPTAKETLEALMDYLASTYGRENCHVDNWIVGNEVNMPNAWNYTGTTDLSTNVDIAVKSFLIVNNAIKRYNRGAKAYLSLDHSWAHNDQGRGIAGKSFLDEFGAKIEEVAPGIDWNLAYHPYAPIMTQSNIWDSANVYRYTTDDEMTPFISAKNLEVLTNYVKSNFGEQVRIILSEQGFTAYNGQENQQAAAMAYTYYAAEFNDMIDATMFRSIKDDPGEMKDGFYFGLYNTAGGKRPVYDVFRYMDTKEWEAHTAGCLSTMGIALWNEVVTYFDGERFFPKELDTITLNKTGTVLAVGYKERLKYEVEPEFAETDGLSWVSDDESIVKVDSKLGELIAVSPGRAIVSAMNNGEEIAHCIVVVKDTKESQENVEKFITDLYAIVTNAAPKEKDLYSYRERLMGRNIYGGQVMYEVISGKEAMEPSKTTEDYVKMTYRAIMNVPEEDVPEDFIEKYVACLDAGMSKKRVIADLIDTMEFEYRCYDADIDAGSLWEVVGLEDLNLISYNIDSDITYQAIQTSNTMLARVLDKDELRDICYKIFAGGLSNQALCEYFYQSEEFQKRKISEGEYVNMLYDITGIEKQSVACYGWTVLLRSGAISRDELFDQFFSMIQ